MSSAGHAPKVEVAGFDSAGFIGAGFEGAACISRPDLPWTADGDAVAAMGAEKMMVQVCAGCPLVKACASIGATQVAGFWAGRFMDAPPVFTLSWEPVRVARGTKSSGKARPLACEQAVLSW